MYDNIPRFPIMLMAWAMIALETVSAINATGVGWEAAFKKAQAFTANLTLEEKVRIVTGSGSRQNPSVCAGEIAPIERLGFHGLCLLDSDLGIGNEHTFSSAFPPGISVSSTWNRVLMRQQAFAIGQEFRQKGVNVCLGPVATIARTVGGGTNYEGYGADPYLNGVNVAEYVIGMQAAGVQANMKQYFGYDSQQTDRFLYSSNMDDKTVHEILTWMYAEGARVGSASVMCSYNAINNTWASANSRALNEVLKTEIGFQGYVLTDWVFALHSTLAANAGMDMDMPGYTPDGFSYFGANLTAAVRSGTIPLWRLNDMVTRIMTPYYHLRQDQGYPSVNLNDGPTENIVNTRSYAHDAIIRRVAVESTILLKNINNSLPLIRPRRVGVFGIDAAANPYGANQPLNIFTHDDPQQGAGTLSNGYGSGSAYYPYLIDPLNALQRRAQLDLTMVDWALNESFVPQIITKASTASVCLAFVQSIAGENLDRNLTVWHDGDNMVLNVANNCRNTIVIIHSVGPIIMEAWIDHPNITAVVWGGLPSQESGDALVDILYGRETPSGKLPYTIARNESDYYGQIVTNPPGAPQINYTEGVFIDYRYFAAKNISVRYPFGYGMSYTTFEYNDLTVAVTPNPFAELDKPINYAADAPGGDTRLFENVVTVTANITNTGDWHSREIAQLYLSMPAEAEEPPAILRGFQDVTLNPGETGTVKFELRRKDVSYWNVVNQRWDYASGEYTVYVGTNFQDARLQGTFSL